MNAPSLPAPPSTTDHDSTTTWSEVAREDARMSEILTVLNDVFDAFADFGSPDSKLNLSPA